MNAKVFAAAEMQPIKEDNRLLESAVDYDCNHNVMDSNHNLLEIDSQLAQLPKLFYVFGNHTYYSCISLATGMQCDVTITLCMPNSEHP